MKKKLSLILCLVSMVLTLGACGTNPEDVDYFGMNFFELQSNLEQEVASLVAFTDENRTYIQSYGTDVAKNLVTTWDEAVLDEGSYQGLGEFSVTKSQDSMTAEQIVQFSGHDVVVSYVYEYNYETKTPEIISASADKVYTFGEKMAKAGMNTLLGMGTVFSVLILISLIISCFKFIPYFTEKKQRKSTDSQVEATVTNAQPQTQQPLTDDLELVAVISAAIAASAGTSTDSFVVRSIHRR